PASEELEARKATLSGNIGRELETTAGLAGQVAALAVRNIDLAEIVHVIERIGKVTGGQVQQFAQAHWRADDMRRVLVGNAREFAEELRKAHPDAITIPVGELDL